MEQSLRSATGRVWKSHDAALHRKNQGEADCPETKTENQIKKQGACEQLFVSTRITPALKRGETHRHSELIRLPTPLTPGAYMACTILDNSDQVREASAENNLLGFAAFAIAESAPLSQ